jgi:hypothetical protein
MTRDAKCFILRGDCGRIVAAVKYPDSSLSNEIAIFDLYRHPKPEIEGYIILSVSDKVDEIILKDGGIEERDAQRDNLRTMTNAFPFIFGNINLTNFLQYLIPSTPLNGYIDGKSIEKYTFYCYNIDDNKINDNAPGVYLFTIMKPVNTEIGERPSHINLSIISVEENNVEKIKTAKDKGAKYLWYLPENSEIRRQEILEDIKAGKSYQHQLATFPELVEP